jgi:hypothetical protein
MMSLAVQIGFARQNGRGIRFLPSRNRSALLVLKLPGYSLFALFEMQTRRFPFPPCIVSWRRFRHDSSRPALANDGLRAGVPKEIHGGVKACFNIRRLFPVELCSEYDEIIHLSPVQRETGYDQKPHGYEIDSRLQKAPPSGGEWPCFAAALKTAKRERK